MPGTTVRIKWNEDEFNKLLEQQTVLEAVWRAAGRTRDRAKQNLTRFGLVDTGALRNSIVALRLRDRSGVWYEIGSNLGYSLFQHEGTGQSTGGYIYPRRAKMLRFTYGSGAFVFARRVRGVTPHPYLTDALQALTVADFTP